MFLSLRCRLLIKNPSVATLRRVYDIFIYAHISISSPGGKYENDDAVTKFCTFLNIYYANITNI